MSTRITDIKHKSFVPGQHADKPTCRHHSKSKSDGVVMGKSLCTKIQHEKVSLVTGRFAPSSVGPPDVFNVSCLFSKNSSTIVWMF